jgi:hypothetical protein
MSEDVKIALVQLLIKRQAQLFRAIDHPPSQRGKASEERIIP